MKKNKEPEFHRIIKSMDVISRCLLRELEKYTTSPTGNAVLHTLIRSGGALTQTQLCERVYRSKNAISSLVNTLEKQKLVKREGNSDDRRNKTVVLTKKGERFTKKLAPYVEELGFNILSCLDAKEIEILRQMLLRVENHIMQEDWLAKFSSGVK